MIIIINYLLISLIVFAFSLISLQNDKVYDLLWIKYIQKNLYINGGMSNMFQHNTNDCVKFDKDLFYVPKVGVCEFSNAEFKTKLNFDEGRRLNLINDKINKEDELIAVIGDSVAMGWGVENDETFSYNLQKLTGKKVINLGVSSYGTKREIRRLKKSKYYDQINTIIIQYNLNDFGENVHMDPKKEYSKKEFDKYFSSYQNKSSSFLFLLKIYKKTLRLLISHLNDLLFPEQNVENYNFNEHLSILEKIILENFSKENKRIILFTTSDYWEKFIYDKNKKYKNFEFFEIKFENKHTFIIDRHPNEEGHKFIAEKIYTYLNK